MNIAAVNTQITSVDLYTVSGKKDRTVFYNRILCDLFFRTRCIGPFLYYNLIHYWPIFKILSLAHSSIKCALQFIKYPPHVKHIATLPREILMPENWLN